MTDPSDASAFRSDSELVTRVAARQPAALLELYDRYAAVAYGLAVRMLTDAGRAEECVQAVFLDLWRQPPPADSTRREFSMWLLAAVYRNARARQQAAGAGISRRQGTALTMDREPQLAAENPASARAGARRRLAARQQWVRAAHTSLPPAERTALELAYLEGQTASEIAERLLEPRATVQTRIRDVAQHLRAVLAAPPPPFRDRATPAPPMASLPFAPTLAAENETTYRVDVHRSPAGPSLGERSAQDPSDQRQDQLLQMVAHELRSPITVIKGTIQLASRRLRAAGHLDEAARLDLADAQVDRLTALVDYLLRAGQLNSGMVDLQLARVDLAGLVREVGAAMQALSVGHTVIVQAPERLVVEADANRLEQVLRNLITNAIKYSPQGGRVEITLARVREEAEVCVRDYGIGIPVAERNHVFERFHRARNVGAIAGFGLGLSMSLDIVRAHHGRLWVGDLPAAATAEAAGPGLSPAENAQGSLLCLVLPVEQATRPGTHPPENAG
jgi:RNA polymerase sigma factor (sigma-70 family)